MRPKRVMDSGPAEAAQQAGKDPGGRAGQAQVTRPNSTGVARSAWSGRTRTVKP
jgi:hypothetical protein